MKKYIIFFAFIGIHAVWAQPHPFQEVFVKNPEITRFWVEMRGDSVSLIAVRLKNGILTSTGQAIKMEEYDFRFEGDQYLFGQKYDSAMLELSSKDVDSSRIVNEPKAHQLLCAVIYPDSITYRYSYTINWPFRAEYRGNGDFDFKRLGLELRLYAPHIAREKDSILFFQALIGLDGNIETMELIQGKGGGYTDEIIDFFMSKEGAWRPLVKDLRKYRSLVDICVRLQSDGKVGVSHSYSMRFPKIEIKDHTRMWTW